MTQYSVCRKYSCAMRVESAESKCPACGGAMIGSSWIKQTGWLMMVFGALIGLPSILLVLKFIPVMLDPQGAVDAGTVALAVGQVPLAMALLALTMCLGLLLLVFGYLRAIKGKRPAITKPLLLGTGFAFFALLYYLGSNLPDTPTAAGIQASQIR